MSDGAADAGVLDVVLPDAPDAAHGDSSDPEEAAFGVLKSVQDSIGVCSVPTGDRSAAEWMALVAECGKAMTVLSAARDAAMVRLAAIDEVVDDDGVVSEQVNGLGTVCVDAGSMVAAATGCSPGFAEELVSQAVIRVVRVPALHEAMLSGLLDDYSARCIASELADAPIDIARAVVEALAKDFGVRSGPALRRRTRELLFKMAPELLRRRIAAARKKIGLRRWVGEPGTDQWGGTFASERAATAWAAVDALARRYRTEDTYPTLEMARAYALLDLVHGKASVTTVLSLTVPAAEVDDDGAATEEEATDAEASGRRRRASAESMAGRVTRSRSRRRGSRSAVPGAAHPEAGEPSPDEPSPDELAAEGPASGAGASGLRPAGEESSDEFASCEQARGAAPSDPSVDTSAADLSHSAAVGSADSRDVDRFVAVSGAQGGSLTWVPRWALPPTDEPAGCRPPLRECHPLTGALIDPDDALRSEAYTPGERLKRLIRARDGRCRFPGCTVPPRSCDIDHVQAWPRGPTSAANLMCLCRRHHRVKQRMRWRVIIGDGATVTWTDPAGHVHATEPVDHLGSHEVRSTRLRHADELVERDDLVGGAPPPTGAVPERRPWLESPAEAVAGVRAEHSVGAVARELRELRRHSRRQPNPFEDRPERCPVVEPTVRRAGSRCGYMDLHPYVEGTAVAVELADEYVGQHGDLGDAPLMDTSEAGPADDRPPF
ncbi:hypothetical protein GA707_16705 [Nostocoides sp. F2B08]|uniref:HNH endonuclease signature motif containing protein n=1 Tax=Nostocoides sp. F2B08 TaxID=2653936 RepID=UPI0012631617|nr:HNH endonuclease signature motif containing protein [Tetrasphaera sp. F2B08]KAB7741855.1 hypothetical protein GA707_16705 [Tetrasphaera sp. F2B08]